MGPFSKGTLRPAVCNAGTSEALREKCAREAEAIWPPPTLCASRPCPPASALCPESLPLPETDRGAANSFILLPSTDPAGNRLRVFLGLRRKMKEKLKMHKKPLSFSVSACPMVSFQSSVLTVSQ